MGRLDDFSGLQSRRVIGLNSGTSMDGIDAMAVTFSGLGACLAWKVEAFVESPLPEPVATMARRGGLLTSAEMTQLDWTLGQLFADAAQEIQDLASWDHVDVIGSHGQTILHEPGENGVPTRTIQLGQPELIARALKAPVVADFRRGDVDAGGQGAPLTPYLDALLFRDAPRTAATNLGGIANISCIENGRVLSAFDIGPANMPIDELARLITNHRQQQDTDGKLAQQGSINRDLLNELLAHEFLHRPLPRTTGREMFGTDFTRDLISKNPTTSLMDLISTVTEWVARSVANAALQQSSERVVVSGGGASNSHLMARLKAALATTPLSSSSAIGIHPAAKEALLFALLAHDRMLNLPTNIPIATGANTFVSLGQITEP